MAMVTRQTMPMVLGSWWMAMEEILVEMVAVITVAVMVAEVIHILGTLYLLVVFYSTFKKLIFLSNFY